MAAHDATAHKGKHVSEFKLLLDESEEAKGLRTQAYKDLRAMSLMKLAHTPVDIIADYLERLLKHTKDQLTEFHGLRDENPVEFVLCVPVKWSYKASWRMQEAMHRAIEASGLGRLDNGGIKGLFIVSEPEAASTFVISQSDSARFLNLGETIVLLDCGGGTVDAITYKVIQTDPVRLREVVPPNGASCGSVFLNKNFEELLRDRLQGATLLGNAISLDHIIKTKLVEWENLYKRTIDITARKGSEKFNMLHIHGLQTDESRRIRDNCVLFDRSEIKDVFKGCLRDVHKLLRDQLRRAKEATDEDTGGLGFNVQRVFMVGGFAESPSLQSHIRDVLSRERNVLGQPIRLVLPRHVDSAVARGAVLRALNKEDGPRRFTRISYGIIRSNLYDPDLPEHQGLRGRIWAVDGQLYIEKCIHWQILVGDEIPVVHEIRIPRECIFKPHWKSFYCEEQLWISSQKHESGYRSRHPKNRGAEQGGRILVNLTFIKDDDAFQPETRIDEEGKSYTYYKVFFDLWIIIEGLNLRFEARSPSDPEKVCQSKTFSLAAGFKPGTA